MILPRAGYGAFHLARNRRKRAGRLFGTGAFGEVYLFWVLVDGHTGKIARESRCSHPKIFEFTV